MANTCDILQKSLKWCQGTPVYPGVRARAYYINKSDIVAWPTLTKGTAGNYTTATYTGDFTLAEDKKWLAIDHDVKSSQLTSEAQGEVPSQTQLNKLSLVHQGVGAEASEVALYMNNCDCVFLVAGMDGLFRVVGSEMWPGKITVAQDTGQGATGTASTTITVEATDVCPAPFYPGKIVTEDGDINGDGSEVA